MRQFKKRKKKGIATVIFKMTSLRCKKHKIKKLINPTRTGDITSLIVVKSFSFIKWKLSMLNVKKIDLKLESDSLGIF